MRRIAIFGLTLLVIIAGVLAFTIRGKKSTFVLHINTSPDNVSVSIDNANEKTITSESFDVTPGQHRIVARKDGYRDYAQTITVNEDMPLDITLQPVQTAESSVDTLSAVSLDQATAQTYTDDEYRVVDTKYLVNHTWGVMTVTTKNYQSQASHIIIKFEPSISAWVQASQPSEIFPSEIKKTVPSEVYRYLVHTNRILRT